jgi:protein SCO1/2
MAMLRTAVATSFATIAAVLALSAATDGFRAFTTEGARRLAVLDAPRAIGSAPLIDMNGRLFVLPEGAGKFVLVEFIYTSCPTICAALGDAFAVLRNEIASRGLSQRVRMVSISFDLMRDGPEALRDYAAVHKADGRVWTVARPRDEAALRSLLGAFGVVVIPDGMGGFVHNAAIHLVDEEGRLSAIYDLGEERAVLAALERMP